MALPKILVIDDNNHLHELLKMRLEGIAEVSSARNHLEARKEFYKNPDPKAILMDGFLPEDTLALTAEFRTSGYTGPIIANSGQIAFQRQQIDAGCSHLGDKLRPDALIKRWLADPAQMATAWAESGKRVLATMGFVAKAENIQNLTA